MKQFGAAVMEMLLMGEREIVPLIPKNKHDILIGIFNELILSIRDYGDLAEKLAGYNERN
jgi:hypothetical protein